MDRGVRKACPREGGERVGAAPTLRAGIEEGVERSDAAIAHHDHVEAGDRRQLPRRTEALMSTAGAIDDLRRRQLREDEVRQARLRRRRRIHRLAPDVAAIRLRKDDVLGRQLRDRRAAAGFVTLGEDVGEVAAEEGVGRV